eukprot:gene33993-41137_t
MKPSNLQVLGSYRLANAALGRRLSRFSLGVPSRRVSYSKSDIFRYLQLKEFNELEIKRSFQLLQTPDSAIINENELNVEGKVSLSKGLQILHKRQAALLPNQDKSIQAFSSLLAKEKVSEDEISYEQYKQQVISLGERLDRRVYVLGSSFLLTGVSVGIIIPCMPILVNTLRIPPQDFGLMVSAFALSKLLVNLPTAHLVEKYGRKAAITSGLALCGLGVA